MVRPPGEGATIGQGSAALYGKSLATRGKG
jgi:hypothetical protein